jgi:hypothetical protein
VTIGFFYIDTGTESAAANLACARLMVQSAKREMPSVKMVQFTDQVTSGIKGVDEVRRKPSEPMALLRMRHHAGVKGDWLFVDTDVYFQRDVRRVFREHEFDIAVTNRDWKHLKAAGGFTARMPFNTGVVFSRSPHFWREVYGRLRTFPANLQQWMGDQEVIGDLVHENEDMRWFNVHQLKGSLFNYPPAIRLEKTEATRIDEAWIVHYKGPSRKKQMLSRGKVKKCA